MFSVSIQMKTILGNTVRLNGNCYKNMSGAKTMLHHWNASAMIGSRHVTARTLTTI
jgi:hypothetical protein